MSTNFNTCFIDSNGRDVSEEFVEKSYLLDVYPNLIDDAKTPSLWTWGNDGGGQLGNNVSGTSPVSSPVQTISGGTNWKSLATATFFAATDTQFRAGAIKMDGTLWLWGRNASGQLGDNSIVPKSSPVQTISGGTNWKQVSMSADYTAAIKTDGTLWYWGANCNKADGIKGYFGNSTSTVTSSPVQTISGTTNWKSIDVGNEHSLAVKTDGTLWVWGVDTNADGLLGTNSTISRSSPVQTVSGGTNWKQVSAGRLHSAAIKTDGTLWLWGAGFAGRLGDNTEIDRSSPVQTVSGGTVWKQVSINEASSAAIKTDGTLWVWGGAGWGVLGTNNQVTRSSPVQTVSGGTNWKQISVGSCHMMAIKTDGTLWGWGSQNGTQENGTTGSALGDNRSINRSSPVQTVSGGTNWKEVSALHAMSIAIREEGDW